MTCQIIEQLGEPLLLELQAMLAEKGRSHSRTGQQVSAAVVVVSVGMRENQSVNPARPSFPQ